MPTISVAVSIFNTFRHSYKVNIITPNFTDEEMWTQGFATDKVLNIEFKPFRF